MVSIDQLDDVLFCQGMSREQKGILASLCEPVRYQPSDIISAEGESANFLYILKNGRADINITKGNGREASVGTITPGRIFGWSSLVSPFLNSADVKCQKECLVLRIDAARIRSLMDQNVEFGYLVMSRLATVISGRLENTRLQLINIMHWPPD
jgi:CRP/FNR family transcriptional regulator, cyclic AMP receptor protein